MWAPNDQKVNHSQSKPGSEWKQGNCISRAVENEEFVLAVGSRKPLNGVLILNITYSKELRTLREKIRGLRKALYGEVREWELPKIPKVNLPAKSLSPAEKKERDWEAVKKSPEKRAEKLADLKNQLASIEDPKAAGAQIYFKEGKRTDFAKTAVLSIKKQIKELEAQK